MPESNVNMCPARLSVALQCEVFAVCCNCPSTIAVCASIASRPQGRILLQISNCERRCKTDLEDIGDGDGVLGGLALGGDDGNGRPRHGVLCGRCCC